MVPAHFVDEAAELVAVTRAHGLEGVVFERLDAPYLHGRRGAPCVKHKHRREQRVVVLGCRASDGRHPDAFGSAARTAMDVSAMPVKRCSG